MKFFISLVLTALLSFVLCLYLPWWSVGIAAFLVAVFIPQRPGKSFIAGFLSILLLWTGLTLWISHSNGNVFIHKISLLILKTGNPLLLVIVSSLIGALVAGFAALTGSFARKR